MELIGHILWTNLFFQGLKTSNNFNKKINAINFKKAIFFGIVSDLVPFGFLGGFLLLKNFQLLSIDFQTIHQVTSFLYNFFHSIIIFAIFYFFILILKKNFFKTLEFFGWLIHIFIDILTHNVNFYQTKFLWPLSDFGINGISWQNIYFLIGNYVTLFLIYLFLFLKNYKGRLKIKNKND